VQSCVHIFFPQFSKLKTKITIDFYLFFDTKEWKFNCKVKVTQGAPPATQITIEISSKASC